MLALEIEGEPERAIETAEATFELGIAAGDQNLEVLGLQDKGRALVALGDIAAGMALVDEAMMRAVGADLDEETTGRSYCNMLSLCSQTADYQRATEWSEVASAWSRSQAESPYPGICRIHRAELMWLRGRWGDAEAETRRAAAELAEARDVAAAAWYQLGVIELRAGRHEEAEAAFRQAYEQGVSAMPGLALLRLAQGDPAAADDPGQPGRDPARQQRCHPLLPLLGQRDRPPMIARTTWQWPAVFRPPGSRGRPGKQPFAPVQSDANR